MSRSCIIVEQIYGWLALIFAKQQSWEAREGVLVSLAAICFLLSFCEVAVVPANVSLFGRLHILLSKWLVEEFQKLGMVTATFFAVA